MRLFHIIVLKVVIKLINLCNSKDLNNIIEIIEKDIFQNIYLYIDIKVYGFSTENIKTYIFKKNSEIILILYKYYDTLQIFQNYELEKGQIEELCSFIKEHQFKMISGNLDLLSILESTLKKDYTITEGFIMKKSNIVNEFSDLSKIAVESDLENIAELICSDKNIGGHYTITNLKKQLLERMKDNDCKNLIIKVNNKIISHFGVYANIEELSVLGGLITDVNYRNFGYGKTILNDLTYLIQKENKLPIIYCYDEGLIKWYEKNGWEKVVSCAKLEKQ